MQIKHVVCCCVEHWGKERNLRKEVEFPDEPTHEQIEEVLAGMELYDSDSEIDYSSGAVLPDYEMPRKSKVQRIFLIVEKRFYREVEVK